MVQCCLHSKRSHRGRQVVVLISIKIKELFEQTGVIVVDFVFQFALFVV